MIYRTHPKTSHDWGHSYLGFKISNNYYTACIDIVATESLSQLPDDQQTHEGLIVLSPYNETVLNIYDFNCKVSYYYVIYCTLSYSLLKSNFQHINQPKTIPLTVCASSSMSR